VIIAAHTTLQSLAVCKLTRTDGFGAKEEGIEKKVAAFYAAGKNTLHNDEEFSALAEKEKMANFPTLMRRLGYDLPKHVDAREEKDATNLALYLLHDFRSTYSHYPAVQLTLEASQVRNIVRIAVDVITSEFKKDDWKRRPLIRVIPPFLTGCSGRIHAAIFSFWAGVMPPMPMFGRSLL